LIIAVLVDAALSAGVRIFAADCPGEADSRRAATDAVLAGVGSGAKEAVRARI